MTRSRNVLIAEDERVAGMLVKRLLESLEMQADIAVDSGTAIDILRNKDIGLALIDYDLEDGETGDRIAKLTYELGIPSIITSSQVTEGSKARELFETCNPSAIYSPKPFSLKELEETIKKFYE